MVIFFLPSYNSWEAESESSAEINRGRFTTFLVENGDSSCRRNTQKSAVQKSKSGKFLTFWHQFTKFVGNAIRSAHTQLWRAWPAVTMAAYENEDPLAYRSCTLPSNANHDKMKLELMFIFKRITLCWRTPVVEFVKQFTIYDGRRSKPSLLDRQLKDLQIDGSNTRYCALNGPGYSQVLTKTDTLQSCMKCDKSLIQQTFVRWGAGFTGPFFSLLTFGQNGFVWIMARDRTHAVSGFVRLRCRT